MEQPGYDRRRGILLAALLVALVARAVPAEMTSRDYSTLRISGTRPYPGDIDHFHDHATLISGGRNPYAWDPHYATYPPIWLGVSYLAFITERATFISFDRILKLIDCLADLGSTALIFTLALSAGASRRTAMLAALLFALNPVSIIITSIHAPNDPVILFLLVLALLWEKEGRRNLAYLALGIGIAIKIYPVLLVPFFFLKDRSAPRARLLRLLWVPIPFLLTLLPFLLDPLPVLRQVASYGGVTDFGYLSEIRTLMILGREPLDHATALFPGALLAGKIVFLLCYGGLLLAHRRFTLPHAVLAVFLLFLSVYGGISAQYLLWVIPLALVPGAGENRVIVIVYSIWAAVAILLFYSIFHPGMFHGEYRTPHGIRAWDLWAHIILNLGLWGMTLFWGIRVVARPLGIGRRSAEPGGTSASPP